MRGRHEITKPVPWGSKQQLGAGVTRVSCWTIRVHKQTSSRAFPRLDDGLGGTG